MTFKSKEKPYIDDLGKLKITKVKPWKVQFKYDGAEYIIIDVGDDNETYLSLLRRIKVADNRYHIEYVYGAHTCMMPMDLIRDISKRRPAHTVYSNIDREYFVIKLAELHMVNGPYADKFKEIRDKERELNSKIRELQNKIYDIYKDWRKTSGHGSKIIGDRLRIQASERVPAAKNGDYCEEFDDYYGNTHPKYGGTLTDLYSLPYGTHFYCVHGCWDGYIGCDKYGDKTVVTENENISPRKLTPEHHSLYIKM